MGDKRVLTVGGLICDEVKVEYNTDGSHKVLVFTIKTTIWQPNGERVAFDKIVAKGKLAQTFAEMFTKGQLAPGMWVVAQGKFIRDRVNGQDEVVLANTDDLTIPPQIKTTVVQPKPAMPSVSIRPDSAEMITPPEPVAAPPPVDADFDPMQYFD